MYKLSTIVKVSVLLCVLLTLYLLVLFYRSAEESHNRAQEDSRSGATILQKLGKHMILPSVQPTIATVIDPSLLKQRSSFFNSAKKGDAIIVYPDKVIIFDVRAEKIVDIGLSNSKRAVVSPSTQYQK